MLDGMPADAADGMLLNLADTKENLDYFGTTGTGYWVPRPGAADRLRDRPRLTRDSRRRLGKARDGE